MDTRDIVELLCDIATEVGSLIGDKGAVWWPGETRLPSKPVTIPLKIAVTGRITVMKGPSNANEVAIESTPVSSHDLKTRCHDWVSSDDYC